jgi:hypothetical protein
MENGEFWYIGKLSLSVLKTGLTASNSHSCPALCHLKHAATELSFSIN